MVLHVSRNRAKQDASNLVVKVTPTSPALKKTPALKTSHALKTRHALKLNPALKTSPAIKQVALIQSAKSFPVLFPVSLFHHIALRSSVSGSTGPFVTDVHILPAGPQACSLCSGYPPSSALWGPVKKNT